MATSIRILYKSRMTYFVIVNRIYRKYCTFLLINKFFCHFSLFRGSFSDSFFIITTIRVFQKFSIHSHNFIPRIIYYIEYKNGQPIFRASRYFVRCYSFLLFFNSGDFIHTFCMATAFKFSMQPNIHDF